VFFEEQAGMNKNRKETGQVEINFTYRRHLGPKFIHGGVTLKFDSFQPYSFASSVVWPESGNYEKYVQEGVEKALIEMAGTLDRTEVVLVGIDFDEVDSTPYGFRSAAYAATRIAFLA
jgi:hypothetical protein